MTLHTYSIPLLRGRRARLRAPCMDDAGPLFALFSDAPSMRWWPRAPMRTPGEATGLIEEFAEHFARGDRIDWIVADVTDDAAIGTCTLYDIDTRRRCAMLGYALLSAHRGRGIVADAATQVIAWGVRTLGLRRIEACVAHGNAASVAVLARLGFVQVEGADVEDDGEPGVALWALDAGPDHSLRSGGSR